MIDKYDVIVVGVGGMGVLTSAYLIAESARFDGYDVKIGEVHGMAQRGGSVIAEVRLNKEKVFSPTIPRFEADLMIGLELTEALRYSHKLSSSGSAVINDYLLPPPLIDDYPQREAILSKLRRQINDLRLVDCYGIAEKIGARFVVNTVAVAASKAYSFLPVSNKSLLNALKSIFSDKKAKLNRKALELTLKLLGS